jgi:hypothetical protein
MATKTSLIVAVMLLVGSGCEKKPAEPKKPSAAATFDGGAADEANAEAAAKAAAAKAAKPADGGGEALAASTTDGDGGVKPPGPPPIPKVDKVQVLTISMGPQDYDVRIAPDDTPWRIPMKATAGDLGSIAMRAKAAPNAVDGKAKVFLGNSVEAKVGQAMMEALRAAGFKDVQMNMARRP